MVRDARWPTPVGVDQPVTTVKESRVAATAHGVSSWWSKSRRSQPSGAQIMRGNPGESQVPHHPHRLAKMQRESFLKVRTMLFWVKSKDGSWRFMKGSWSRLASLRSERIEDHARQQVPFAWRAGFANWPSRTPRILGSAA